MSSAQPQSVGTYLYCVTYSQPFAGNGKGMPAQGLAGCPIRVVRDGDLAAIVSDSLTDQYDITLDNVTAHERVIEQTMTRADVLPASFGIVAGSDQELREGLLQLESGELHRQLEIVKNRVELGVKALWEQSALFAEIAAEDSQIQALRDQIIGTTPEQTYDIRIQLGELTDAAIQRMRERDSAAILNVLSPLAEGTRTNRIITDMMILNAAFLVDKNRVAAFEQQIKALEQSYAGRVIFQYAGPLPPYNFVSIVVGGEEPSDAITQ